MGAFICIVVLFGIYFLTHLFQTGGLAASDLQKVYLEVYSDTKCETSMFSASKWYHICAGVPQGSKGICNVRLQCLKFEKLVT